jgi:hypothetical protein
MRTVFKTALIALCTTVACSADPQADVVSTGPRSDDAPGAGADIGSTSTDDAGTVRTNEADAAPSDAGAKGDGDSAAPRTMNALAKDVPVQEIAFYQGVKVDVVAKAAKVAQYNAPVVAGRDALVRVFVAPDARFTSRPLVAELTLVNGADTTVLKANLTPTGASTDATLGSTFNFDVAGASLTDKTKFSVAVRDPAVTTTAVETGAAEYPQAGTPELLGVQSSGPQLKVVVVPIQYAADGSNRVPDTSAAQLETYRKTMYSMYPAAKVEVTARAPWKFTSAITADGTGFSQALQALQRLRHSDGVDDDVYYYGAFSGASSFGAYCGSGCVTGLSGVGEDASDALVRASLGIGFTGNESAWTMAHELGHAHGRYHAPCGGAAGADPDFPYTNGGIGVWGYNLLTKQLVASSKGKDLMGYCTPEWISDYTYQALFDRMQFVNGAKATTGQLDSPAEYRYVNIGADGALSWGETITLGTRPGGAARELSWLGADGAVVATGTAHVYTYDHLPGGYALVPEGPSGASRAEIRALGALARAITR